MQNFDILSQVGTQFKAISKDFLAAADSVGTITVQFAKGNADFPTCEGIEVIPDRGPFIISPSTTVAINSTTILTSVVADGAGYIVPPNKVTKTWAIGLVDTTGSVINSLTGQFTAGGNSGICPINIQATIYGLPTIISLAIDVIVK